ncbi:hypothetical protein [Brumicola pallidula]|uniref:3-phosphoshikimate 1-carboxyvinyltransferase n=1 Tax=Brumicola pallidula DSM 14239 = ACAM 615 TaxID=1121922 RepID=K6Z9J8_9ALTE|nr:hypothetical protein [Glaciecola pallidula]GAC27062.1 hypothetical protein GPAL_0181 [Glaciecola pallidula DSM 14239 = ACAM 615]
MKKINAIRKDPDVMNLLSRLPDETALSLTDRQLSHIKVAVGNGGYRKHKIDCRGTIPIPFYPSRIYFVLLMGRNIRAVTRREKSIALMTTLFLTTLFLSLSTLLGLVVLYILKSALGIDLFEGSSLGLWNWLKQNFG